jgi:DNA-binding beta-propeller fold protein YncE
MHLSTLTRRDALAVLASVVAGQRTRAASPTVTTVIGTGVPGLSDREVANPYGIVTGPDRALYFCDLDNQRVRRFDSSTGRTSIVAGNGERGHSGDGGRALDASLNMPHEVQFDRAGHLYIAERDSHVVRKVDAKTGRITTFAGTGEPGFSGDGGPASAAALRQPHSIAVEPAGRGLLICDVGNHRLRRVDLATGVITTIGGTGERVATPDGAPLSGTPLNGPRTMAFDRDGHLYLALREGNAIYRIDAGTRTLHHVAGTGQQGYSGDGGPARTAALAGPKGLAWAVGALYIADTENHVIRRVDLRTGVITTVLGSGERGDGPELDPRQCALNRPHGLFVDRRGALYVTDSEAHRIRVVRGL